VELEDLSVVILAQIADERTRRLAERDDCPKDSHKE